MLAVYVPLLADVLRVTPPGLDGCLLIAGGSLVPSRSDAWRSPAGIVRLLKIARCRASLYAILGDGPAHASLAAV